MLSRVNFEEWQSIITIVAFALCFLTFVYFTIRAIRMKKSERDHLSNLPLEDTPSFEESKENNHGA